MMDPRYEADVQSEKAENSVSDTQKHWNTTMENANHQNYPYSFAADAQRAGESIAPNAHPKPRVHRSYPNRVRHVKQHGGSAAGHRFVVSPDTVNPD